jgi:hypothetical protein
MECFRKYYSIYTLVKGKLTDVEFRNWLINSKWGQEKTLNDWEDSRKSTRVRTK